jgi:uncharacterized DUF497 family protein
VTITFDPAKRAATLAHRGLDFADAAKVFEGEHVTWIDDRFDYGEVRQITAGLLEGRRLYSSGPPAPPTVTSFR